METQEWLLFAGRDRAYQRNNGFCHHFFLEESCPSSSLPGAKQFISHMSLGASQAAAQCCVSEGVSTRKFMHELFKRNFLDSSSPLSTSVLADFYSQKLWGLFFPALGPWVLGGGWRPGMDLGPLTPEGGTSAAKISLLIFICHIWEWYQLILHLHPSY